LLSRQGNTLAFWASGFESHLDQYESLVMSWRPPCDSLLHCYRKITYRWSYL